MRSIRRALAPSAVLLVLGLVALLAGGALGARGAFAPPTVVVTVDLKAVLDKLDQRLAAENQLQAMGDGLREEDEQRTAAKEALRDRMEALGDSDDAARLELAEQLARKRIEHDAWKAFALQQLDIEKSVMLRDLSRSVDEAIVRLAEANGYDIVLVDDSDVPLTVDSRSQVPREEQVKTQLRRRRIAYAAPSVNVTDELIARMNNAFAAGPAGP